MSQCELYPVDDAGKYWSLKGCWVDFVFYYKKNDQLWIPSMCQASIRCFSHIISDAHINLQGKYCFSHFTSEKSKAKRL